LKDIVDPNAAINPDQVAYIVELINGESLLGVQVGGTEAEILFGSADGKAITVRRDQIVSMTASTLSLMPEGLLQGLSEREIKDLMTFLLLPPPLDPAVIEAAGEPPPRARTELEAVLSRGLADETLPSPSGSPRALRVVLCAGPKTHGLNEHDYPLWQERWAKLFALAQGVTVETAWIWPEPEQFATADVIVFYSNNPGWTSARAPELETFLDRGGGLAYIHYAVDGHAHCDELAQCIGLAWKGGQSRFRHGPVDLRFNAHAITAGFEQTHFVDETYWNLVGDESRIELLATAVEGGEPRPQMWVREHGRGRVFVCIPGHYTWTFDDPLFRLLLLRGIAWAAREPVDRFSDLITVGARIAGE
jgi:type 1 glutamine amidotransferase